MDIGKQKVMILGVGGCRPDDITAANTPNLDALMSNGTYFLGAGNTGTTLSSPGLGLEGNSLFQSLCNNE